MDTTYLLSIFVPILIFIFITMFIKTKKPNHVKAPEPNGAWPIIGHLHLLGGKEQLLYRTLGEMANRYGPAMSLRLGSKEAFVVSSFEVAKECFTVNDKALASRPMTAAAKHMGYNFDVFGFAPYSSFWREMRKIATVELLELWRLQMLKHVRVSKISIGALILGGSDTTASTLTWAIALLLNNKETLKKAQDEINLHVGTDRNIENSDIENLVYLQAIIKETFRLYPVLS